MTQRILAALFLTVVAFLTALTESRASELGRQALAAREGIKSGEFTIVTKQHAANFPPSEKTLHFVVDGDRIRFDQIKSAGPTGQAIRESVAKSEGFHWDYTNDMPADSDGVVATMTSLGHKSLSPTLKMIPDPRYLGIIPIHVENFIYFDPGTYLDSSSLGKETIRDGEVDGVPCKVVEYRSDAATVRLWIAPSLGPSVLKCESEFGAGKDRTVDQVVSSPQKDEDSGVYFPSHFAFRRTVGGKVTDEQTGVVTVARINQPFDKDLFKFAGMDIPAGHPVSKVPRDPRGKLIWDGSNVVAVDPPRAYGSARWSTARKGFVGLSIVLAIVAVALAWSWSRAKAR